MLMLNTLQIGDNPTLIAGIVMLTERTQAQTDHPDIALTVSSVIGSLVCVARF